MILKKEVFPRLYPPFIPLCLYFWAGLLTLYLIEEQDLVPPHPPREGASHEAFRHLQMDGFCTRLIREVSRGSHRSSSRVRLPEVPPHRWTAAQTGSGRPPGLASPSSWARGALCPRYLHPSTARGGAGPAAHPCALALRQFPRALARRRPHTAASEPTGALRGRGLLPGPVLGDRTRQPAGGPGRADQGPEGAEQTSR